MTHHNRCLTFPLSGFKEISCLEEYSKNEEYKEKEKKKNEMWLFLSLTSFWNTDCSAYGHAKGHRMWHIVSNIRIPESYI